MIRLGQIALTLLLIVFSANPASALDKNAVVLTIDGGVKNGTAHDFSIAQLEAMGMKTIETTTPWHDGKVVFEGVSLSKLMEQVGASGEVAAVLALNNYRTDIPLSDFTNFPVILAIKKDGAYMPISDKGPLFIIYPFDSQQELKNELFFSRSAWQVRRITIE